MWLVCFKEKDTFPSSTLLYKLIKYDVYDVTMG
jgi:hypothetical protein